MSFTLLRNGWYTENYTDQLSKYLKSGEILGAAGDGKISAASRQDYAAAAAAALLQDEEGNRTYELGGPAFDLSQFARIISEVTGTKVTYRDLPVEEYADALQWAGLASISTRNNSVNMSGVFGDGVTTQANWMISFLPPNQPVLSPR